MPLILDNPETVALEEVKILNFQIIVEPEPCVMVQYAIGDSTNWSPIKPGAATFSAQEIASVDPQGATHEALKVALYKLLEQRLGGGSIT